MCLNAESLSLVIVTRRKRISDQEGCSIPMHLLLIPNGREPDNGMGRENGRLGRESLPLAQIQVLSFVPSKASGIGGYMAPLFCKMAAKTKDSVPYIGFPNLPDSIF